MIILKPNKGSRFTINHSFQPIKLIGTSETFQSRIFVAGLLPQSRWHSFIPKNFFPHGIKTFAFTPAVLSFFSFTDFLSKNLATVLTDGEKEFNTT